MTRPTRLTPEELEKVKKLLALAQNKNGRVACGVDMSSMVDLVYGGIPGLFRHIAALDEEIEDLCKTRKDLLKELREMKTLSFMEDGRLRAFCEGLEMQNMDKLMTGKIADFFKIGQVMSSRIKQLAQKDAVIRSAGLILSEMIDRYDFGDIKIDQENSESWIAEKYFNQKQRDLITRARQCLDELKGGKEGSR